jgi:hypothetical protein
VVPISRSVGEIDLANSIAKAFAPRSGDRPLPPWLAVQQIHQAAVDRKQPAMSHIAHKD